MCRLETYLTIKKAKNKPKISQKYRLVGCNCLICYFNQPRFLKYHIGTTALSSISTSA